MSVVGTDGNFADGRTSSDDVEADGFHTGRYGQRRQFFAIAKRLIADGLHAVSDGNGGQVLAVAERTAANDADALGDGVGSAERTWHVGKDVVVVDGLGELAAAGEQARADAGHAVGKCYCAQHATIRKSTVADGLHTVGNLKR